MPENTIVLASHDGIIAETKDDPNGYGRHIKIMSDEIEGYHWCSVYGHLSKVFVSNGQRVYSGEKIGLEGNTGYVISGGSPYWGNAPAGKGVHLHFGIRKFKKGYSWSFPGLPDKSFDLMDADNGLFGYIDPMPLIINNNDMKHVILNGNQFVIGEIKGIKVAYGIADVEDLNYLGVQGEPEAIQSLDGYKIFNAVSPAKAVKIANEINSLKQEYYDMLNL